MKKDVDIKNTIINIFLVSGILLFLGSLSTIIKSGFQSNSIIFGIAGVLMISISITLKTFRSKRKTEINDKKELIEKIINDGYKNTDLSAEVYTVTESEVDSIEEKDGR